MKTVFLGPSPLSKEPALQGVVFNDLSCGITARSLFKFFGTAHDPKWLPEFIGSFERFGLSDEALEVQLASREIAGSGPRTETFSPETVFRIAAFIAQANDLGLLSVIELKHYKTALRILAFTDARGLTDDLEDSCGLNRYKMRQIERFSNYFSQKAQDDACRWIIQLPIAFWTEVLRIGGWTWPDFSQKPHSIAPFVFELFFNRASDTLLLELRQQQPKRRYGKHPKIGNKNLESQLAIWMALMRAAPNREKLMLLLDEVIPSRGVEVLKFGAVKLPDPGSFGKSLKILLEQKQRS